MTFINQFLKLKRSLLLMLIFPAMAQSSTILLYHHVSSETPRSTSVSVSEFNQHVALIESLNLTVVPITTIVDSIKAGESLNPNWIAITFDDGYKSIYDNALPILKQKQWPFTVFVNPNSVKTSSLYMNWEQIEELTKHNVTIANHTLNHENLVQDGLSIEEIKHNILNAEQIIKDKLDQNHKMLAYPYGEYNEQIKKLIKELGFVGFAQHSGAINEYSDLTALTRFPANGIYANPKTLKNKINSLPFNIKSITPNDTAPTENNSTMRVELIDKDFYTSQLACFVTGSSTPHKPKWIDKLTFELSAPIKFSPGRVKYNCTAPSISQTGRFYWMSKLWIVQK